MKPYLSTLVVVIFAAALTRLLPHPWNFTPITAVALFSGSYLPRKLSFLVPLLAMAVSDLILGIHATLFFVYGSFALVAWIGQRIGENRTFSQVGSAVLASSFLFFMITNFGVWVTQSLYLKTVDGLVACYIAALPFFQATLAGDLFYTAVLFGGFALATLMVPSLRESTVAC